MTKEQRAAYCDASIAKILGQWPDTITQDGTVNAERVMALRANGTINTDDMLNVALLHMMKSGAFDGCAV